MPPIKIPRVGVIGYPIKHSLSPKIHNYWLKSMGVEECYERLEVKPEELEEFIQKMPENGFRGVNVTIPHKEAALNAIISNNENNRLTEEIGGINWLAQGAGAANTIIVEDDNKIRCTNTDIYGFTRNIEENAKNWQFSAGRAVVLGAGGAARGVIMGLIEKAVPEIILINRTKEKAEKVREDLSVFSGNIKIKVVDWEEKDQSLKDANLLVNTTSLGMEGQKPLEIDLTLLPKEALVTDIVYKPLETDLLKQARERGNQAVTGIGMLFYQAAKSFEYWLKGEEWYKEPQVTEELIQYVMGK